MAKNIRGQGVPACGSPKLSEIGPSTLADRQILFLQAAAFWRFSPSLTLSIGVSFIETESQILRLESQEMRLPSVFSLRNSLKYGSRRLGSSLAIYTANAAIEKSDDSGFVFRALLNNEN